VLRAWRQNLALGLAFLLALSVLGLFGYRAVRHARYLRWEGQPIHAWMTIPFVAHTHHVPREVLYAAIHVGPREHDRRPLRFLARQQHRPVEEVIRDLDKAIAKQPGKAP
jgi:hypothetical protein